MIAPALAVAVAFAVVGTTIPPLAPAELVSRSDVVAEVVVTAHHSEWVGRRILTFYDADVLEVWSSSSSPSRSSTRVEHVVIALPGGIIGDVGQAVPGTPALEDGSMYVVCVGKPSAPHEGRAIIGLWQGVWSVDEAGVIGAFTHEAGQGAPAPTAGETVGGLRARLGLRAGAP